MTPSRNTRTGAVLEQMVLPALKQGGYRFEVQVGIGKRLEGGQHFVDVLASKGEREFLVSLKWQQVSGTAEQKVPFEIICLLEAMDSNKYSKAYLVLGGEGWTLRNLYTSGKLEKYLAHGGKVDVVTLESFIAKANDGLL
jgi:hypothetical protein